MPSIFSKVVLEQAIIYHSKRRWKECSFLTYFN